MSSIMILNDAPSCGITYNCHSDKSRGIISNHNMFILQATYTNIILPMRNVFKCFLQIHFQGSSSVGLQQVVCQQARCQCYKTFFSIPSLTAGQGKLEYWSVSCFFKYAQYLYGLKPTNGVGLKVLQPCSKILAKPEKLLPGLNFLAYFASL